MLIAYDIDDAAKKALVEEGCEYVIVNRDLTGFVEGQVLDVKQLDKGVVRNGTKETHLNWRDRVKMAWLEFVHKWSS
jgi:hypothetical protein